MVTIDQRGHIKRPIKVTASGSTFIGHFDAMASPCEVIIDTNDKALALSLTQQAAQEAWRIEQKFSRYRQDGIIPKINQSQGKAVPVDQETATLLDFAYQCYELSEGLFDISSGILRRIWQFNDTAKVPSQQQVAQLLPKIGLNKARWHDRQFTLPAGMEIDLGGIGKEYAVDRVLQLLSSANEVALLVNFGGDIAATKRTDNQTWHIGIEAHKHLNSASKVLSFYYGGIATSGDSRRFILHKGQRLGHILNPKTGWPVRHAPHSVTVMAGSCTQAGILSTLAMLQGAGAEEFLQQEESQYWLQQ